MNSKFRHVMRAVPVALLLTLSAPGIAQIKNNAGIDPAVLQALSRDLAMTPEKVIERVNAERVASEIHPTLRNSLGAGYAGAWFDPKDQKLVVATSDPKQSRLIVASGARAVTVKRPLQELNNIHQRLDQSAIQLSDIQRKKIWQWGVDVTTNAVVITVPANDREALLAAQDLITLGRVDAKAIRIEQADYDAPVLAETLRGGDRYNFGSNWCSVGFAVTGGFVTAGHCAPYGTSTTGFNGVAQGTFAASTFPGEDRAWVASTNGLWTPAPCAGATADRDCSSVNNRLVVGSTEGIIGQAVCRYGATTGGPFCGMIQLKEQTVTFGSNTVNHLTQTNICAQGGDSGGPFIANYHGQGTLTGTTTSCSTPHTWYYPLNLTLAAYGLTLTVASGPPPVMPANFSVTYFFSAGKYHFTASWTASPGTTVYHLMGHVYNGPNTSISWVVPQNFEDLSIEYSVYACNAYGCSPIAGPQYAQ